MLLSYRTFAASRLLELPLARLAAPGALVAIWSVSDVLVIDGNCVPGCQ